jgi:hypothetical protein
VECFGGPRGGFYRVGGGHPRGDRSNDGDEWLLRPLRLGLKGIKGGVMRGSIGLAASAARSGRRGERRRGGDTAGVGRCGEDETDKWGPCVSMWIVRRRRERKA